MISKGPYFQYWQNYKKHIEFKLLGCIKKTFPMNDSSTSSVSEEPDHLLVVRTAALYTLWAGPVPRFQALNSQLGSQTAVDTENP